jgi:protein TonB
MAKEMRGMNAHYRRDGRRNALCHNPDSPEYPFPMPEMPVSPSAPRTIPRLSRRSWIIIGAAFGIGLLLFLLLWAGNRNDNDFYRADAPVAGPSGQVFEPLPVPMPADEADNTPAPDEEDRAPGMVGIDETRPAPPPAPPVAPAAPPATPAAPIAPSQANTNPVPIGKPSAPYPIDALRNGESGTVLLRVTVGPDGAPYGIALARTSRSRSLDRAAMSAVRNWRFRPAMRNGQPVAATVQIPVSYDLGDR